MRRVFFAFALLAMTAAAMAQTADDRFTSRPSRENPSAIQALQNWLGSKLAAKPKLIPVVAAAPAVAPTPAPQVTPTPAALTVSSAPPRTAAQPAPRPARTAAHATKPKPAPKTASAAIITPKLKPQAPKPQAPNKPAPQLASLTSVPVAPATIAAAPAVLPAEPAAPEHKKAAGCQRIISAYYWQGKHTASGAPFNPNGLTAAHRTLPFGTKLVVTNPRTKKTVTVTVNDRGPFVKGVSLDLSLGAAKLIGMRGTGAVCMAKA